VLPLMVDAVRKGRFRWIATEALGRLRGYRWKPPVTRVTLKLMGEEVTVVDSKARIKLGDTGLVSPVEGLAEMRSALRNTTRL
jgi:hypothetical protein